MSPTPIKKGLTGAQYNSKAELKNLSIFCACHVLSRNSKQQVNTNEAKLTLTISAI